jgi:hypothetical protein
MSSISEPVLFADDTSVIIQAYVLKISVKCQI